MRKQMTTYIEQNGMINRLQSGFRSNHSTTTALLKITNDLLMSSEESLVALLVLLDFYKAFDSVEHLVLCSKLSRHNNFSTSAVTLIMSYLNGRREFVWIGDQASKILPLTSDVIQGSVLGPLLFSMFINDITNAIESSHYPHMYADDVQLYISCHPFEFAACVRSLNLDSYRIQGWSQ
jgi:hypothetical protein